MPISIDQKRIEDLIARPTESLNVEIKRWINPEEPGGEAKIVRAALALRNRNGGFLVVGFDDKTLQPDTGHEPADVGAMFHIDKIQGIVSRYASELFEVGIGFGERDGVVHPVVLVPEGVRVPVAAKSDLKDEKGKLLVRAHDVYFRTLGSNGTVSSASARSSDWREIVEICFENREADIGRFLRRHLGGHDIAGALMQFAAAVPALQPQPTLRERAEELLNSGEKRFLLAVDRRTLGAQQTKALSAAAWEVALVVDPLRTDAVVDTQFLNSFAVANPNYTGWPVWLDSRGFSEPASRPVVVEKGWEALIVSLESVWSKHLDFMRLDPKGEFYLRRLLQDDLNHVVAPGKMLDPILVVLRTAEAIAVGLSVVKATGWSVEQTKLGFAFRWTNLSGRQLASWANPMVSILSDGIAIDDRARTYIELPLDTPIAAIAPYVEQATNELFSAFGGYKMQKNAIEEWVRRLIERKLN